MKKIYLVDDDEDDRMFARQALESVIQKIEITELTDGKQLLALLKQNESEEPALILMDINMPCMIGLEALSSIRNTPDLRHLPVVMFSTSADPEAVTKAYQMGVNAYITKPVLYDDYIRMVQAVDLSFLNRYDTAITTLNPGTTIGKNVLVIEDNDDHYALIKYFFKHDAPQVNVIHKSTAGSVMDFLNSADKKVSAAIDLIILDLYLPTRQQGLDLLVRIRGMFAAKGLVTAPIVILSASPHPEDIKVCYQHQANAYLVKTPQPAKSFSYLTDLCFFWWNIITPHARAS